MASLSHTVGLSISPRQPVVVLAVDRVQTGAAELLRKTREVDLLKPATGCKRLVLEVDLYGPVWSQHILDVVRKLYYIMVHTARVEILINAVLFAKVRRCKVSFKSIAYDFIARLEQNM